MLRLLTLALLLSLTCHRALAQDAATDPPAPGPSTPEAAAAETPTAPPSGEPAAEPELRTATSETPVEALPPKVTVVLVGDPDDGAIAAAEALLAQLEQSSLVRLPTDVALRRAMLGRGADDGLDGVRSERRALGLSERRDVPALVRLGRLATAVVVIVVRAVGTGHEATVLDVNRAAFFDGALSLPAADADAATFVGRRARSANRAADAPAPVDSDVEGASPEGDAAPAVGVAPVVAEIPATEAPAGDPVLQWFEQNWAYLAAGALLAGGVAFVVVVATEPGAPPPMIRVVPGE